MVKKRLEVKNIEEVQNIVSRLAQGALVALKDLTPIDSKTLARMNHATEELEIDKRVFASFQDKRCKDIIADFYGHDFITILFHEIYHHNNPFFLNPTSDNEQKADNWAKKQVNYYKKHPKEFERLKHKR